MANRIYNYSAFYVAEPFSTSNLGANSARDFCYYNMLKAWKARFPNFPFLDAHETTYDVRDSSSWEDTLKPRLHERLRNSQNIILFLSSATKNSRALREEIDYGINVLELPVIVVYPEYDDIRYTGEYPCFNTELQHLWNKLPVFRDNYKRVPTVHISFTKELLVKALSDSYLTVQHKQFSGEWYY